MKPMKLISLLLALCLLLAMVPAVTAEDALIAAPVDEAAEETGSELWTDETGEAAKYTSGNLAHFV